jgi:hypothetical protein
MLPLDALNIIYPIDGLEELAEEVMTIREYSSVSDESSEEPPLIEYKRTEKAKTVSSSVNESDGSDSESSSSDDEDDEESSETLNNIEIVKKPSDEPSVALFDYKPVETGEAFLASSQKSSGDVIPTKLVSSEEDSFGEENNTATFKIPSENPKLA